MSTTPPADPLDRTLQLLMSLGREVQLKDPARAADCFRQAAELARGAGRDIDEVRALIECGHVETQRGQLAEAERCFDRAVALAREAGDELLMARCLNRQSLLRISQGRNDDALALLRDALSRMVGVDDPQAIRVRGETLERLGIVYRDRGDTAQALRYYQESLEIARACEDERTIGARLNQLGNLRHRMGQFDEAVAYFREAREKYRVAEYRRGMAVAANNLGTTLLFQGELDEALADLEESRALFKALGEERSVATILSNLGTLEADRGRVDLALAHYEESLAIHRELEDLAGQANALNNLSHLAVVRGDPEAAIRAADESLELRRRTGTAGNSAKPLYNRGEARLELGRLEEAARDAAEARESAERSDSDEQRAEAASLAALVAIARGDAEGALAEAERAVEYAKKVGGPKLLATSHHALAATRIARREYDLATQELARATRLLRGWEHAYERARVLTDEGRLLASAGSLEGAVERLRRAEREFAALGNARWRIRVLVELAALAGAHDPAEQDRYLNLAEEVATASGNGELLASLLAAGVAAPQEEAGRDDSLGAIRASRTQELVNELTGAALRGGTDLGVSFEAFFRFVRRGCGASLVRFEVARPALRGLIAATAPAVALSSPPGSPDGDLDGAQVVRVGGASDPLGSIVARPIAGRAFSPGDVNAMEIAAAVLAMSIEWHLERMDRVEAFDGFDQMQQRFESLVGASPAMRAIHRVVAQVAPSDTTVLVLGESGTGKELAARAIHARSRRSGGPFVAISCPSIPRDLIESELFGHEKGAFTGAMVARPGKVEIAHGGTLFLDEIGDMAVATQVKLLRFLQEREFQRVGGNRDIRADVRVVAATSRDLALAIERGEFREDLYYRLHVVPIRMPSLRERKEDIPALVNHFLDVHAAASGTRRGISARALEALREYHWPGNVRELQNLIERLATISERDMIDEVQVSAALREMQKRSPAPRDEASREGARGDLLQPLSAMRPGETLESRLMELESRLIRSALEDSGWNQSEAARKLGVTETKVRNRMKQFGIRPPKKPRRA